MQLGNAFRKLKEKFGSAFLIICSIGYIILLRRVAFLGVGHAIAFTFIIAGLGLAAGAAVLALARFTRIGRKETEVSLSEDWSGTVVLSIILIASSTTGFTALSAGLYRMHHGTIKGGPLHGAQIVDAAYDSYVWHLLDAVPLLHIPSTLHWTLRYPFTDHLQGGLVLLYTLTCIIPFLYVGTKIIRRWWKDDATAKDDDATAKDGTSR